jgi:hypothetical protein
MEYVAIAVLTLLLIVGALIHFDGMAAMRRKLGASESRVDYLTAALWNLSLNAKL